MTPTDFPSGARRNATPANAARVPKVAIVAFTFRIVTIKPFIIPHNTPANIPAKTAATTLFIGKICSPPIAPTPAKTVAATTEPMEAIDPTEISSAPQVLPGKELIAPFHSKPTAYYRKQKNYNNQREDQ
jgi:hypothetical protein